VPVDAVQTNTVQADTIQAGTVLADTLRGDDLRTNAELAGNMATGKVPATATIGGGKAPSAIAGVTARSITILLLAGPVVAVAVSVPLLWGRAVNLTDLILFVILYAITGHGLTVGFHRLFTHRSF
jgi:stearoyl-CoA desaturase (delta-9 desaturase)